MDNSSFRSESSLQSSYESNSRGKLLKPKESLSPRNSLGRRIGGGDGGAYRLKVLKETNAELYFDD